MAAAHPLCMHTAHPLCMHTPSVSTPLGCRGVGVHHYIATIAPPQLHTYIATYTTALLHSTPHRHYTMVYRVSTQGRSSTHRLRMRILCGCIPWYSRVCSTHTMCSTHTQSCAWRMCACAHALCMWLYLLPGDGRYGEHSPI